MSKTNQVCVCCEQRDTCPHYDTRKTVCNAPIICDYWSSNSAIDTTDWKHYRIQAAIAAMGVVKDAYNIHGDIEQLVHHSVRIADALVA